MNPSKKIDISKSSLVSLKAELSRKQDEVNQAKASSGSAFIHPVPRPKKLTILTKKNKGVDARDERDAEEIREEEDLHRKSRAALEAKSKLYDKLNQASSSSQPDDDGRYLVDFQKKAGDTRDSSPDVEQLLSSDEYDEDVDPEDDWVDYTDCLGRTRRCLRRDLDFIKNKDEQLVKSLNLRPEVESSPSETKEGEADEPELVSNDMRLEELRQKWEKQEELIRDKKDVHYQDVLFDEARSHGVGYFAFSQQEAERAAQLEALNKQRQDTQRQQQLAQELRERREKQLQARLQAARARNRKRLGLPPEEPGPSVDDLEKAKAEEEAKKKAEEEELKKKEAAEKEGRFVRKPKETVRPWDVGKEGVSSSKPFQPMSQEEWVKKKREERPHEFAPTYATEEPSTSSTSMDPEQWSVDKEPSTLFFTTKKPKPQSGEFKDTPKPAKYQGEWIKKKREERLQEFAPVHATEEPSSTSMDPELWFVDKEPSTLFFTTKKPKPQSGLSKDIPFPGSKRVSQLLQEKVVPQPVVPIKFSKIRNELSSDSSSSDEDSRGKGVEIGPPPPHVYASSSSGSVCKSSSIVSKEEIEKSIEAGLAKLRREHEERKKRRDEMPIDLL